MFRLQTSANFGPGVVTLAELEDRVRTVTNNLATIPVAAEETFGAAVTKATRRLVHPGTCTTAEAAFQANENQPAESFGEEIRRAAEKDPRSRKAAAERGEREKRRYHRRGERRKPTRSG